MLGTFHERVNDLAGSEFLKFSAKVWGTTNMIRKAQSSL